MAVEPLAVVPIAGLATGLTAAQIGVAVAVALPSAFIRGLSGFGLALMLVPVLAITVTPEVAVVTVNAVGVVMGLASVRTARLDAERSARMIAVLAIALTPVGLALLTVTPAGIARLAIALVALVTFAIVMLPGGGAPRGSGPALTGATGVCCGLCAGFAGIPGPPVIAFYMGRRVDRATARASMFIIFLATSTTGCLAALLLGIVDAAALWLAAILSPVVLLGSWLGGLAFGHVNERAWRLFAGAIVAGSAVVALVQLF